VHDGLTGKQEKPGRAPSNAAVRTGLWSKTQPQQIWFVIGGLILLAGLFIKVIFPWFERWAAA